MLKWQTVECWADANSPWPDEVLALELAPGSTTGYKGVHKVRERYEARVWVKGKGTRVAWRSDCPRECAWTLARLKIYPCELRSPKKGRAKPGEGKVRSRAHSLLPCPTLTVGPPRSATSGDELAVLSRCRMRRRVRRRGQAVQGGRPRL